MCLYVGNWKVKVMEQKQGERKLAKDFCCASLCLRVAGIPALIREAAVQMYLYVGNWKFKVMERKEVERQAVALRMTALDGKQPTHSASPQNGTSQHDNDTLHDLENGGSATQLSNLLHPGLTMCTPSTSLGGVYCRLWREHFHPAWSGSGDHWLCQAMQSWSTPGCLIGIRSTSPSHVKANACTLQMQ